MTYKHSLFILLAFCWAAVASSVGLYGLNPRKSTGFMQINVWNADHGLPVNSIFAIAQSPDGFLWLGMEAGICRFDGIGFTQFNRDNIPGLNSEVVNAMRVDGRGRIWIGLRGSGVVLYEGGEFSHFTTANGLLHNEVWAIMESADGVICLGTRNGISTWQNGKISSIPLPEGMSNHYVKTLFEDRQGRIWAGTRGGGLARLTKYKNSWSGEYLGFKDLHICALLEDRRGILWMGARNGGIVAFHDNKKMYYSTPALSDNSIQCLYEDSSGNIWIGSQSGGVNVIPAGDMEPLKFTMDGDLPSDSVMAIFEDREHSLWLGTECGGLVQIRETSIITYTNRNKLSSNIIFGVCRDQQGRIWAGTSGSGVNYLDPVSGGEKFRTFTSADGFSNNFIIPMMEHPVGVMWFGTLGGGVNRLENGKVTIYDISDGLSDNFVRCVFADTSGNIWAGTDSGGLHRLENGRFNLIYNLKFRINGMLQDRRGNLWIATFGDGLKMIKDNQLVTVMPVPPDLAHDAFFDLYEDRNGVIWCAALNNGLVAFHQGKITVISRSKGLPDSCIYSIQEDRTRRFWLSSNAGIICVEGTELDDLLRGKRNRVDPLLYGKENGMKSRECNGGTQATSCQTDDGRLWFPTVGGLSVVNPLEYDFNPFPPPVAITSILVNGVKYPVQEGIEAPPGQGDLEFSYAGLSFVIPKHVSFKYRLEGYDKEWIDAKNRRTAYYTNIPAGRYRFRVTAANANNVWNPGGADIAFRLRPFFFQTPWFIISAIIFLGAVGYLLRYILKNIIRVRILKRKGQRGVIGITEDEADKYLRKMVFLIEQKQIYKNANLSLRSLAEQLKINPRYLSTIINERLQKNFFEMINQYRVKEAQTVLSERSGVDDKSILEVAYDVGFNSKSAFNRAFKQYVGMTPSEYRRNRRSS